MSLGFLTESALLPSKAKEIRGVDSKSILDLKAIVLAKDQERRERKNRLADALDDRGGSTKFRGGSRLKSRTRNTLLSSEEKAIGERRNHGVEKRSTIDTATRDLNVNDSDDDVALHKKSKLMLERKAQLYEQMVNGNVHEDGDQNPSLVTECLVDFAEKRQRKIEKEATIREGIEEFVQQDFSEHNRKIIENNAAFIQVKDEFGRFRQFQQGSREHREYVRSNELALDASSNKRHESNNGFVVSQWENTLKDAEKRYLQEVHNDTVQVKKTSLILNKQERKRRRVEQLKQQVKVDSGRAHSPPSGEVDVQASEFLSSLMTTK